jgi:hypothetical protein
VFPPGWPNRLAEKLTREEDANIQCEIYQVPLASITTEGRPYFATLSYAWGDQKPAKQIRCGRALVFVGQSLHDALVYIRHPRTPRLVWVDCLFDADTWSYVAYDVDNFLQGLNHGKRLFTTDNSAAWLGTGLDGTRVGDVVCVLSGGDVPFILRQVGNKGEYKLIGEYYVAGIMHGEALDMGLEEREFRLI